MKSYFFLILSIVIWGLLACENSSKSTTQSTIESMKTEDLYLEGENYYLGINGKNKDYKKAFEILKKAAQRGHTKAQIDLAQMYYDGVGTTVDYEQAFFWLQKAAKSGEPAALYNL